MQSLSVSRAGSAEKRRYPKVAAGYRLAYLIAAGFAALAAVLVVMQLSLSQLPRLSFASADGAR